MNRKVQAVDPSSGVWLLGKVCGETGGNDGTFHVKWQDYKEKTHVMKYKTRQPELKRKYSVKDQHWPHFKSPTKLQRGDIVQLIGTQTLENSLNVEENDPFRGEITTSCGQLLKYEAISEGKVYSLSPSEVAEAGLALPSVVPPSSATLHSTSKEAAHMLSIGGGGEVTHPIEEDVFSYDADGLQEGMEYLASFLANLKDQGKKVTLASSFWPENQDAPNRASSDPVRHSPVLNRAEPDPVPPEPVVDQNARQTEPPNPIPDRVALDAHPRDQDAPHTAPPNPDSNRAEPDDVPPEQVVDQDAPHIEPPNPIPDRVVLDEHPRDQDAPHTAPRNPDYNRAEPDPVPLEPVVDQNAPQTEPPSPIPDRVALDAHPRDQDAPHTAPLNPDSEPVVDHDAPHIELTNPITDRDALDAASCEPVRDQNAPDTASTSHDSDSSVLGTFPDLQLDSSILNDFSFPTQSCMTCMEVKERLRIFEEKIMSELKVIREGLGLWIRPNQTPLNANNVLEVINTGAGQAYKVSDIVIENLMPYNSDVPTVARKLADFVFSDTERCSRNISGRKGKDMLDPVKVSALRRAVLLICPSQDPDQTWRKAVKAIDSASRYIRLKKLGK